MTDPVLHARETPPLSGEEHETVDVVFRVWEGGVVIALMPGQPADTEGRYCTSYEHVGQHGGADYRGVLQRSRPARPEEYADLLAELTTAPYDYRFRIVTAEDPS